MSDREWFVRWTRELVRYTEEDSVQAVTSSDHRLDLDLLRQQIAKAPCGFCPSAIEFDTHDRIVIEGHISTLTFRDALDESWPAVFAGLYESGLIIPDIHSVTTQRTGRGEH
ncbi:hypothetical protein [Nocardia carnea]|uniref:hypothetical protein n=1 Tax=Nocardia carnea TaxID=37328 RepID=UPI0024542832|nr:hypothetical protein [Nocardia carnea]